MSGLFVKQAPRPKFAASAVSPATGVGDATPWNLERRNICLADLKQDELRALITELNEASDRIGCVVFDPPGPRTHAVVIFAGNLERFHMLAVARRLRCVVIYAQDTVSWWYQGSTVLCDIDAFCRGLLIKELGTIPVVFFGQSSGAYAALAASSHFIGSTVVACAPQTFSDSLLKSKIEFIGIRALAAPEGLVDLRARLSATLDMSAMRAVVIAAGELDNPATAHWWGDYLHMLRLVDVPGVFSFIVNANSHVIVHGRVNQFAELLASLVAGVGDNTQARVSIVRMFLDEQFGRPSDNA